MSHPTLVALLAMVRCRFRVSYPHLPPGLHLPKVIKRQIGQKMGCWLWLLDH